MRIPKQVQQEMARRILQEVIDEVNREIRRLNKVQKEDDKDFKQKVKPTELEIQQHKIFHRQLNSSILTLGINVRNNIVIRKLARKYGIEIKY